LLLVLVLIGLLLLLLLLLGFLLPVSLRCGPMLLGFFRRCTTPGSLCHSSPKEN